MAKGEKNSIVFFYDLIPKTKTLTDAQFGKLIRSAFAYDQAGEEPNFDNDVKLEAHFEWLRYNLDENREKYLKMCEKRRENGRKGGRPKKATESEKPK